jgi:hypothetical protein
LKKTLYPRYCPNLLCQKIWYGEKGKEIYCPRCGTKGKGVERLRASLRAIADGLPTSRPAATGNDDLDTAYNLQATAVAALKEPDLGPPDFVYQRFNVLDKEESHNA